MTDTTTQSELTDYIKFFTGFAIQGLVDSLFVLIWASIQYFFSQPVEPKDLAPIDQGVHLALQILMGIATTVPVAMWIYKDIRIMWIRIQRRIQREIQLDGNK